VNELTTFVGLDVHKKTISVAVAYDRGEPFSRGVIRNEPAEVAKLVEKLGASNTVYAYEAGPCGYALYRQLHELGARCVVAAPSKMERAPGDRVKTDRRDALQLARQLQVGSLPTVWVPEPEDEALRDLTRARQTAQQDLQRLRNRLTKLVLRLGLQPPSGVQAWTVPYRAWLKDLKMPHPYQQIVFEDALHAIAEAEARVDRLRKHVEAAAQSAPRAPLVQALMAMRGIGVITATTLVGELGDISRFDDPRHLMGYSGLTPIEDSTGERVHRGHITHTGNAHLRHVLGEMAWNHPRPLKVGKKLQRQRKGQPQEIVQVAERADTRLHRRYHRLVRKGKAPQEAATAIAREALGFIWAIARLAAGLPVPAPRPRPAAA